MKKFQLLVVFTLLLFASSCSNKPDNKVLKEETDCSQATYIPQGAGKEPLKVCDTTVTLAPTFGQSVHYANENHPGAVIFRYLFFLLGLALIIANKIDWKYLPQKLSGAFPIVICFALWLALQWPIGTVQWNNYNKVSKAKYEQVMRDEGSTESIWQQWYDDNLITGAKYHKK